MIRELNQSSVTVETDGGPLEALAVVLVRLLSLPFLALASVLWLATLALAALAWPIATLLTHLHHRPLVSTSLVSTIDAPKS